MTNALLVSETAVKKYGIIDSNVDPKLIEATTIIVQDLQLQPILGTSLYNELLTQCPTFTSLNITLMDDYIVPFLLNAIIADGCTTFLYRFSNKGPVTSNSENDFPISTDQVNIIEQKWQGRAEFYSKRLSLYLCEKSTDYPLYASGNTELQQLQPDTNTYHTGWALNHNRRREW